VSFLDGSSMPHVGTFAQHVSMSRFATIKSSATLSRAERSAPSLLTDDGTQSSESWVLASTASMTSDACTMWCA